MKNPGYYRDKIEVALKGIAYPSKPRNLYEPISYTLRLGGKRVRPVLCLMASDLFEGDLNNSIYAALSLEIFHNFTLLHDDIMDESPIRRGHASVYKKWNSNIAILSGDTMFAMAYEQLFKLDKDTMAKVLPVFGRTAIEVCEGQQYDMNFEIDENVSIPDYLNMIRLKTAVLLAASLQIGAVCGGAEEEDAQRLYAFGENTGIAFQLIDDYLDTFGDEKIFGKKTGNDIITGKKTFLMLRAHELCSSSQLNELKEALSLNDDKDKVERVTHLFEELGIRKETQRVIAQYHDKAIAELRSIDREGTELLESYAEGLLQRVS